MKTLLKLTALTLPLLFAIPTFAQVSWGVDLHFGTPPPRHEVIVARPYPEAEWVPGYYRYYPGHRYAWYPGFWRRPERFEARHEFREHEFRGRFADRDHGHDNGRDRGDSHRGRIR